MTVAADLSDDVPTAKVTGPTRRIMDIAAVRADDPAIVFAPVSGGHEEIVGWRRLADASLATAVALRELHVGTGSTIAICAWNSPELLFAMFGAWTLGACVLPLSPRMPEPELRALLAVARPSVVLRGTANHVAGVPIASLVSASSASTALEPEVPVPGKAIASGGSTGRPKIVVDPLPWGWSADRFEVLMELGGIREDQVQLVPGPLYHNTPFTWCVMGLLAGHTVVLMERFDAARAVELIERHRVGFTALVPTMMKRIADLPDLGERDLSSIESVFHTAAPCPPVLKRRWLELLGATRVYEGYGSTEGTGGTRIRGDEWLDHPGSVGLPHRCDIEVRDERLRSLPVGRVGTIHMRPHGAAPTYRYLGADPLPETPDGFVTIGDMGWLDDDGYLFVADRRADLVITGGANVYPAEVEAALLEHPEIADVAVVGLPDDDLGKVVHAVVQANDPASPPSTEDLDAFVRERISGYKAPRSYELVEELPRDDSGKIRRSSLIATRDAIDVSGSD